MSFDYLNEVIENSKNNQATIARITPSPLVSGRAGLGSLETSLPVGNDRISLEENSIENCEPRSNSSRNKSSLNFGFYRQQQQLDQQRQQQQQQQQQNNTRIFNPKENKPQNRRDPTLVYPTSIESDPIEECYDILLKSCLKGEKPIVSIGFSGPNSLIRTSIVGNGQVPAPNKHAITGPIVFCVNRIIIRSCIGSTPIELEIANKGTTINVTRSPSNKLDLQLEIHYGGGTSHLHNSDPPKENKLNPGTITFTSTDKNFNECWKFYLDKCALTHNDCVGNTGGASPIISGVDTGKNKMATAPTRIVPEAVDHLKSLKNLNTKSSFINKENINDNGTKNNRGGNISTLQDLKDRENNSNSDSDSDRNKPKSSISFGSGFPSNNLRSINNPLGVPATTLKLTKSQNTTPDDSFMIFPTKPTITKQRKDKLVVDGEEIVMVYPETQENNKTSQVKIIRNDIRRLEPGEFLNDSIIEFYSMYIKDKILSEEQRKKYFFFNSFFYKQFTNESNESLAYEDVKKWTGKEDLFSKDFIFVPINYAAHWSLMIICYPGADRVIGEYEKSPCMIYLDSLFKRPGQFANKLRKYLTLEWKNKKSIDGVTPEREFNQDNFPYHISHLPLQNNGSDCGVFLLHYLELFCKEPETSFKKPLERPGWFSASAIHKKRRDLKKLIYDIRSKQYPNARSLDEEEKFDLVYRAGAMSTNNVNGISNNGNGVNSNNNGFSGVGYQLGGSSQLDSSSLEILDETPTPQKNKLKVSENFLSDIDDDDDIDDSLNIGIDSTKFKENYNKFDKREKDKTQETTIDKLDVEGKTINTKDSNSLDLNNNNNNSNTVNKQQQQQKKQEDLEQSPILSSSSSSAPLPGRKKFQPLQTISVSKKSDNDISSNSSSSNSSSSNSSSSNSSSSNSSSSGSSDSESDSNDKAKKQKKKENSSIGSQGRIRGRLPSNAPKKRDRNSSDEGDNRKSKKKTLSLKSKPEPISESEEFLSEEDTTVPPVNRSYEKKNIPAIKQHKSIGGIGAEELDDSIEIDI
ncbi:hypothetical protein RB653_003516 [Dictyostelium firmibasis]|uniref:Ubiquitin-like protease family profile domain-containing protein n=1 Tax=Dictyostelium firmibasis TaxID=79012 RepID=A0AAN7U4R6_9MYCE